MLHFSHILPGIGSSDHAIAVATTHCELQVQQSASHPPTDESPCFDCSNTNWQRLNDFYMQADWASLSQQPSINDAWILLKQTLLRGLRNYAKVVTTHGSPTSRPFALSNGLVQLKRAICTLLGICTESTIHCTLTSAQQEEDIYNCDPSS